MGVLESLKATFGNIGSGLSGVASDIGKSLGSIPSGFNDITHSLGNSVTSVASFVGDQINKITDLPGKAISTGGQVITSLGSDAEGALSSLAMPLAIGGLVILAVILLK